MLAKRTGMRILGTDLCEPFIAEAKENYKLPNLEFDILDFNEANRFNGDQFDYIVGNGILHHLYPNIDKAFANIKTLLKSRGRIIFMEPNLFNPYVYLIFSYSLLRKVANLEPDEMAFSKNFAIQKLRKANFNDIKVEYRDFLLPGVPDFLIEPSIKLGNILEKSFLNVFSQSLGLIADHNSVDEI